MPKINDKDVYPQDSQMSMEDYLLGSNYNTASKKTQTFSLGSIFSLFYNFLGFNAFLNTTDTTTYPIPTPGCMYAYDGDDNLTDDLSEVVKITFSSQDTYSFEASEYFEQIVNSGKFIFKFINLENKNNFVYLSPSNFVLNGTGTAFDVDVSVFSNLENGTFVNHKKYLLVLEFNPSVFNPADYDLSDFTNTSGDPFINESDLITALNNLGVYNTIITDASFVKDGQDFTGNSGSEWNINGTDYTNTSDVDITIPLATSGYHRWDRIVLNTSNTFVLVQGPEVLLTEEPPVPTLPINSLDYTLFRVTDTEVGDITYPIIGSDYVEKSFASSYAYPSITGTDAVIPLPANGASTIIVNNASLTSISGFDLSLIIGNTNAKVPYLGKEYTLENQTNNNITLKHLSSAAIKFFALDQTDLIIPPGKSVRFNYGGSQVKETFKNWSSQKYKTISSNTTLDNTFHNAIVWVIGNCNITIPSGLRSDFACTLRTFRGVTANYLTSGTTINSESDGSTQAESSMVLIATYSTNNFILSGGGLS